MARRAPRRFGSYAAMEAGNVFLVPLLAVLIARPPTALEWTVLAVAAVATSGLLVIGTLYWRGKDRQLRLGSTAALHHALGAAERWRRPLLTLTVVAAFAILVSSLALGWTRTVWTALALTILAALEYVNYYHRQLQHFDNLADLRRLLTGRGVRPSHMARDLARFRRRAGA